MNENVLLLFNNAQKLLKQQLINYMHSMYELIYREHHTMHALAEMKKGEKPDKKKIKQDIDVVITLPGLPDDATLENLYKIGVLTYEAYIGYLEAKHGVPKKYFYNKAQLDLLEVNGIKKDTDTSSS